MTIPLRDSTTFSVRRLGPDDAPDVLRLLEADAVHNVMMTEFVLGGGLGRRGAVLLGAARGRELVGVAFVGRTVALSAAPDLAVEALARAALALPPPRMIIGERAQISALWEVYRFGGAKLAHRYAATCYRLEREDLERAPRRPDRSADASAGAPSDASAGAPSDASAGAPGDASAATASDAAARSAERPLKVELAEDDDVPTLAWLDLAMISEDLGPEARSGETHAYRERLELHVRAGRVYVGRAPATDGDARTIVFKAQVTSRAPDVAQLGGIYTTPGERGRGVASRALREVCRRLLQQNRTCTLFARDENVPATRLYRALGFRPHLPYLHLVLK